MRSSSGSSNGAPPAAATAVAPVRQASRRRSSPRGHARPTPAGSSSAERVLAGAGAHDAVELPQHHLGALVAQQGHGDALAAQLPQVQLGDEQPLVIEGRLEDVRAGRSDHLRATPEGDRLVHAHPVDEDHVAGGELRVGAVERPPRARRAQPVLVDRGEVTARRRRDVDDQLRAVERQQLRRREVPEVLADADAQRHPEAAGRRPQHGPGGEEATLVEETVGGQEDLAVHVPQLAALEQRGGDEEAVVVGLLDEGDHRRQTVGGARQVAQAGVVETHRHLGVEVLEQVAGQPQLGEDDQVGGLRARIREHGVMAGEVLVERTEAWRDLGQGNAQRRHPGKCIGTGRTATSQRPVAGIADALRDPC